MAKTTLAGSRIRNIRMDRGVRQADLARRCDISPSYLNLIEHNRRRIGGALLGRIADALETEAGRLSDGADDALIQSLEAAAKAHAEIEVEQGGVEELAERFSGWARLIEVQSREISRLEEIVESLGDRLTHDPFLSASMHNVLSSVTAIRSASAILANGEEIEPEWQSRFHRNIYEDSQRLAHATETLVGHLEADETANRTGALPQDEFESWISSRNWRVSEIEDDPDMDIDSFVDAIPAPFGPASRDVATVFLRRYADDARRVPADRLTYALQQTGDPASLAREFNVGLPIIYRRLATLSGIDSVDQVPYGLVGCDGSGTLIFRKPVPGYELPRYGAACPLWPLFQALQRPMVPISQVLAVSGRDENYFATEAIAEIDYPGGYSGQPVVTSWMLIRPLLATPAMNETVPVGASCRICAHAECHARREPFVFEGR